MGTFKKVAYTGPVPTSVSPGPAHPIRYLCRNLREEENQAMTHKLQDRVRLLRSLSIEIGAEVRYQNGLLSHLDGDLDRTDGALYKAVARVAQLTRNPQYYYFVVIFLFSAACVATLWCLATFR